MRDLDDAAAKIAVLEARLADNTWPGEVDAMLRIAALEERVLQLQQAFQRALAKRVVEMTDSYIQERIREWNCGFIVAVHTAVSKNHDRQAARYALNLAGITPERLQSLKLELPGSMLEWTRSVLEQG